MSLGKLPALGFYFKNSLKVPSGEEVRLGIYFEVGANMTCMDWTVESERKNNKHDSFLLWATVYKKC